MRIKNSIHSITTKMEVPFYDVDAMQIVWHGNYIKYMEKARCELLNSINYNYLAMEESGYIWPVVDLRLKYVKSAKFGQVIYVEAVLVEYESRLKIAYRIYDADNNVLTKAYTIQVAVDINTNEMKFASPKILIDKLEPFVGDL